MIAFKLWSNFGVFRDPLTITQNITFGIPPKTTIGGMLAAILGIDYNNYFQDESYFDFQYSVVLLNPIRKKSFAQNYVEDYTKKSENKFNALADVYKAQQAFNKLIDTRIQLEQKTDLSKREIKILEGIEKKILKAKEDYEKKIVNYDKNISNKMPKPKPIQREILLNPSYLIFIKDYKYEDKLYRVMISHQSAFTLYMGNSEFPANYDIVNCNNVKEMKISELDSFVTNPENIEFETEKKYTLLHTATRAGKNRSYFDYRSIVVSDGKDRKIKYSDLIDGFSIKTSLGEFNCEFI